VTNKTEIKITIKLLAPTHFVTTQQVAQVELQHSAIISMTHRGKAVPAHAIQKYRGNRDTAPLILNIGTRQMFSRQPHTQATLPTEKKTSGIH
jgi:hypothetical protein